MQFSWLAIFVVTGLVACSVASGHEGRRFVVSLELGQLVVQGQNTGSDDGAPAIRPYTGAIHDHWRNNPLVPNRASATFPEFDLPAPTGGLADWPLYLNLLGAGKWDNPPPMMVPPDTVPHLVALEPGELIGVSRGAHITNTDQLGSLPLIDSVPAGGLLDIGLLYEINRAPVGQIHYLQFSLSSGNSAVMASDPFYVILSPDGANHMERRHHAALFLENYLATRAVPEPASIVSAIAALFAMAMCRSASRWGRSAR
jgi:hypothetical protein